MQILARRRTVFTIVAAAGGAGGGLVENVQDMETLINRRGWKSYWADAFAARSIKRATSFGLEIYAA